MIALFLACHGGSDRGTRAEESPPDSGVAGDTGPTDADADGWVADDDCDDANPWVYPGAAEWCDPIDHDCDGEPLAPGICGEIQLADALWTTSWVPRDEWHDNTYVGVLGPVGDLDGDGASEWLGTCGSSCTREAVGESISTTLLFRGGVVGRDQQLDLDAMTWFSADLSTGATPVDIGDTNGDGQRDLAILTDDDSECSGIVRLLYGPGTGWGARTDVDSVNAVTWQAPIQTQFGRYGVQAGDFDGDGLSDMVVGAPGCDAWTTPTGGVWILPGAAVLDPTQSLDDDPSTIGDEQYGMMVHPAGDLDGDGTDDLVTGDFHRRYLISGLDAMHAAAAPATDIATEVLDTHLYALDCTAILGDLDGDGYGEVVLGDGDAEDRSGALYVYSGLDPTHLDIALAAGARGSWLGGAPEDKVGETCWRVDMDGDGAPEIASKEANTITNVFRVQGIPDPSTPIPTGYRWASQDYDLSPRQLGTNAFGDYTGDGRDDAGLLGYEKVAGAHTGTALIAGWEIPWDEAEYW